MMIWISNHSFESLSGLPRRRRGRQRVPRARRRRQGQRSLLGGGGGRPRRHGLAGGAHRGLQPQLLADLGGRGNHEADGRGPDEAAVVHPAQHGAPQPGWELMRHTYVQG